MGKNNSLLPVSYRCNNEERCYPVYVYECEYVYQDYISAYCTMAHYAR